MSGDSIWHYFWLDFWDLLSHRHDAAQQRSLQGAEAAREGQDRLLFTEFFNSL